jgi:hypothetical protein
MLNPVPPSDAMINIVEKRNANGGVTTAANAVPLRPSFKPPAQAIKIATPVNIPTFVKLYSIASKRKISKN